MKTKEEILNDSKVWLTENQRRYVVEAMQEYADQKVKSDRDKRIVEMGAATEAWINELKKQLTAKDNEISRLNGIITEQARLSELVSGDLQKAQKEIQELRANEEALRKAIDKIMSKNRGLEDTVEFGFSEGTALQHNKNRIRTLESENASLRAEVERLKGELAKRDQPESSTCNPDQA